MVRALAAVILILGGMRGSAQEPPRAHFVRASGEATISAKPDRAEITIGVTTQGATAEAASTQNAQASARSIASIKQVLGAAGQVRTSGYSLSPQYDYSNGHKPKLTGYEASNSVLVTVDDLQALSKVIDQATAAGANNINGVSFSLKDPSAVRRQALSEAAKQARENASELAKALGVSVVGVLEAEPNEVSVPRPMPMMARKAMVADAAPTPMEAGNLDIRATVTVTLEVR